MVMYNSVGYSSMGKKLTFDLLGLFKNLLGLLAAKALGCLNLQFKPLLFVLCNH